MTLLTFSSLSDLLPEISRQMSGKQVMAFPEYEDDFVAAVKPVIESLYRAGMDELRNAPITDDYGVLYEFFLSILLSSTAYTLLKELMNRWMATGFGEGILTGIRELGLEGTASLTDKEIAAEIRTRANTQSQYILQTTARNLADQVSRRTADGQSIGEILAFLATWIIMYSSYRARLIAAHEGVWATRAGLLRTFLMNGIAEVEFRTQRDNQVDNGDPMGICAVIDGRRFRTDSIPEYARIPLHFGCRCYFKPVLDGWKKPGVIWTG